MMVKLNSKACIWYSPERFEELGVSAPAEDWDDLVQLTDDIKAAGATPWSLGAGDSWTLTDWFEEVYLKMNGTEAYDTLFSPDGDWTDPTVQAAIDKMLEILNEDNIEGGVDGALATAFVDGIAKVFSTSPSAELYYEGGFVGGIATGADVNPDLEGQEGTAIDWFDFPTIDGNGAGQITYGGDVIAALVNDSDVAAFMEYMSTPEAGTVWAEGGTIISPLVEVDTSVYPTSLIQKEAEQVTSAEAVRFDGSDLLPSGPDLGALLQSAFRGEDTAPLLDEFQAAVTTAWEEE
jgi:alpha-glucoside transport system substrate-binding protein